MNQKRVLTKFVLPVLVIVAWFSLMSNQWLLATPRYLLVGGASEPIQPIELHQPWVRSTAMADSNTGGYVEIVNNSSESVQLVQANAPGVRRVELHTHIMDGGVARMRQVESIEIPPGSRVSLAPGGLHIMLMGVSDQLVEGSELPLELTFSNGQMLQILAKVMTNPPTNQGNHHHH